MKQIEKDFLTLFLISEFHKSSIANIIDTDTNKLYNLFVKHFKEDFDFERSFKQMANESYKRLQKKLG